MSHLEELSSEIAAALERLYDMPHAEAPPLELPPDAKLGHLSMPCFPLARACRKAPALIAKELAGELGALDWIQDVLPTGPYLNFRLKTAPWFQDVIPARIQVLPPHLPTEQRRKIVVEFSCPNTNKPQHLGHVRNNVLGLSLSRLLAAVGHTVVPVNLINDRGVHICRSMLAWQRWGNGETPESTGIKGDHLVGRYYVLFATRLKEEEAAWRTQQGFTEKGTESQEAERKKAFEAQSKLIAATQQMLLDWEHEDPAVRDLWQTMNGWVLKGFEQTYDRLGVRFERVYYESNTYLLGKEVVEQGLEKSVFERHQTGAIVCPLPELKLDPKVLLRSDGTSIYMTQDLGTAVTRQRELAFEEMIYVVGNEQEHHFRVLFTILKKMGFDWADNLFHLSYGMVNLTTGRMKSREGRVVDADDLLDSLQQSSLKIMQESERRSDFSADEQESVAAALADGALKYFVLKVNPKLDMIYDPDKSIELAGDTGPYLQYAHARIRSLVRKSGLDISTCNTFDLLVEDEEIELLKQLAFWPRQIQLAAAQKSPARLAGRLYELARSFSNFFNRHSVFDRVEDPQLALQRVALVAAVGETLRSGLELLGITAPDRI